MGVGGAGCGGAGLAPPERRTREAPAELPSVRSVMEAPRARRGHRPRLGHLPGPHWPSRRDLGSRARDRADSGRRSPGGCREAAHLPGTGERGRAAGRTARGRARRSGRSRAAAARVTRKSQPQGRPDIGTSGRAPGRRARWTRPRRPVHVRRRDALLTAGPAPGAEPALRRPPRPPAGRRGGPAAERPQRPVPPCCSCAPGPYQLRRGEFAVAPSRQELPSGGSWALARTRVL